MEFNLKRILQALLFSTSEPLAIKDIQAVITRYHLEYDKDADDIEETDSTDDKQDLPGDGKPRQALKPVESQSVMKEIVAQVPSMLTATQVRDTMDSIANELEERQDVYRLVLGPHGYRLVVDADYADWVRLLREEPRPKRLSPAVMETLTIIAYRQPVTRAEIEAVRGVSADNALNRLLEHDLIAVTGRAELPGRPLQYGTTEHFLEFVGIREIEELPASDVLSPNQISEWIRKATNQEQLSDKDLGLPEDNETSAA